MTDDTMPTQGWVPTRLRTTTDAGRIPAPAEGDTMASGMESHAHLSKREGEGLTLFDERSQNDFYGSAHLVEEWTSADMDTFTTAAHHLTIGNLKEGIRVAEAVERELQRRAREAAALADNLRRVAAQASIYGKDETATEVATTEAGY